MLIGLAVASDVMNVGVSPYTVEGDPVVALIAQLNRFAGKSVRLPSPCTSWTNPFARRKYLNAPIPLNAGYSHQMVITASMIIYDRLYCSDWVGGKKPVLMTSLLIARSMNQEENWLKINLADVTVQIAQFADSLGLDPASTGITERDLRLVPSKFPTGMLLLVGALAVGAGVLAWRTK